MHGMPPTRPLHMHVAQQRAHKSARHPCGRRDLVSQGRARLRGAAPGWRSGTPPRRIKSQHRSPVKGSRHAPARLLPLQENDAPVGIAPAPPILRASFRTAKNRRDRRHRAAASARPWCALLHTHDCKNVKEGAMECMQGSEVGRRAHCVSRARGTSWTGFTDLRTPWRTRRVDLAAGAAALPCVGPISIKAR